MKKIKNRQRGIEELEGARKHQNKPFPQRERVFNKVLTKETIEAAEKKAFKHGERDIEAF